MIAVIRIAGLVKMDGTIQETLSRLRLRRKYACVLIEGTEANLKLLKKIRDYISYGEISQTDLQKLIGSRAMPLDKSKKVDVKTVLDGLGKKPIKELGIKPFFRLHSPRGGIDSKKHFGTSSKAVLGHNKEIGKLIGRML